VPQLLLHKLLPSNKTLVTSKLYTRTRWRKTSNGDETKTEKILKFDIYRPARRWREKHSQSIDRKRIWYQISSWGEGVLGHAVPASRTLFDAHSCRHRPTRSHGLVRETGHPVFLGSHFEYSKCFCWSQFSLLYFLLSLFVGILIWWPFSVLIYK
jgi:hypothetical protein